MVVVHSDVAQNWLRKCGAVGCSCRSKRGSRLNVGGSVVVAYIPSRRESVVGFWEQNPGEGVFPEICKLQ